MHSTPERQERASPPAIEGNHRGPLDLRAAVGVSLPRGCACTSGAGGGAGAGPLLSRPPLPTPDHSYRTDRPAERNSHMEGRGTPRGEWRAAGGAAPEHRLRPPPRPAPQPAGPLGAEADAAGTRGHSPGAADWLTHTPALSSGKGTAAQEGPGTQVPGFRARAGGAAFSQTECQQCPILC